MNNSFRIHLSTVTMRVYLQIENDKLHFCERAQSICGSFDYINHTPGGSDKKVCYNA